MSKQQVVLIILDGWGINKNLKQNPATLLADTPNYDKLIKKYSNIEINASGKDVGLPEGLMGNSEVGHLNIGAGRIVYQDISRIDKAIEEKTVEHNPKFQKLLKYLKQSGKNLHLMGLLSDGGVHTHIRHLFGFLDIFKQAGIENIYIHPFLDGRDTPPKSGIFFIKQLEQKLKHIGVGKIASVMGRYYAMDRDNRWERVKKAYDALVFGRGEAYFKNAEEAVTESYNNSVTDEFMEPVVIVDDQNIPVAPISDEDAVLFFNFRGDRAREITRAFVDKDFNSFEKDNNLNVKFFCLKEYAKTIDASVIFEHIKLDNILSEVLSENNLKQLRIAETEKYAHVTFFFNGGVEKEYLGEDRVLIPSPKVATYDLQPEMSAFEVKDTVIEKIKQEKYDVIILNFANPDMVGHTGILPAAIKAVEVVDTCIGEVIDAVNQVNGVTFITSDHGNAEIMTDEKTGGSFTAHTTNKVPFICIDDKKNRILTNRPDVKLADIAPTILDVLEIKQPDEMTGKSLLE
jgi:2,3-bisphosphoglycerate-independent phosphoglycerate mutase